MSRSRMKAVAQKSLLGSGLLVLTLVTRSAGSSLPCIIQTQRPNASQSSSGTDAQEKRWLAQLDSSEQEKRREAVMELSQVDGSDATSAILKALGDRSPRVRAAAAAALAERRDTLAVLPLAASLAKDKDAFVRKMAAYALGGFRGSDRTAALVAALKDKDGEVRGSAAISLGVYADADAIAPLSAALGDRNGFVRAHAARALGVNGSSAARAVPQLNNLLTSDEDGEVKRQVATALGLIGDRAALPALELARHDKDPHLVLAAIESIRILKAK